MKVVLFRVHWVHFTSLFKFFWHLLFTGFLFHEDSNGKLKMVAVLITRWDVSIVSGNCLPRQHLLTVRTLALCLCVYIFHKCYNLYSVVEQDAIFCCLKVLQFKKKKKHKTFSFNMALSGVFFLTLKTLTIVKIIVLSSSL